MDNSRWEESEDVAAVEELYDQHKEAKEHFMAEGKVDINNLVWKLAPGNISLDEADKLACDIYFMIASKWEL